MMIDNRMIEYRMASNWNIKKFKRSYPEHWSSIIRPMIPPNMGMVIEEVDGVRAFVGLEWSYASMGDRMLEMFIEKCEEALEDVVRRKGE